MTEPQIAATNAEVIDRARRVTAAEIYDIGTRFPAVFEFADGSWMQDVEGNRILDVTAASGALLLGNRHPRVVEAICRSIREQGTMFASTISLPRIELAERLCEHFPCGEKAVFCKTGSEATTAAIRLARAATGKDIILSSGFHGWHDWHLTYLNMAIDPLTRIACFGYNETALERLLEEHADQIAGVIVTPEPAWVDMATYQRWSALCAKHGVIFILDEVVTGFRYGHRGVNGTGGVAADLITVSKGLANGHSIAAVIGRRDVIDAYDEAGLAGTYTREVPPMAAAIAVLEEIEGPEVHDHCSRMGQRLRAGLTRVLEDLKIPACVGGPDMMFDVVVASEELSWDLYRSAFDFGAWFEDSGTHMVTAAYTEADVDHAIESFRLGAGVVAERLDEAPPELPHERRMEFAREAFGGRLDDDPDVMARIDVISAHLGKVLA